VHFPVGPDGAHGLRNDTDKLVRYVVAGVRVSPEVAEYPDHKKITAQARTSSQTGEPLWVIHDVEPSGNEPTA
jgi:uncharacterized cupin superfamily protein